MSQVTQAPLAPPPVALAPTQPVSLIINSQAHTL